QPLCCFSHPVAYFLIGVLTIGLSVSRFFFSSRRRHTISTRDWSSDVCSSDLGKPAANFAAGLPSLEVKVPTLVIWGEKDTALLTGNLEGLDRFVPNLTIKRIPDGTHWVIHEIPALVDGYILEFIKGK